MTTPNPRATDPLYAEKQADRARNWAEPAESRLSAGSMCRSCIHPGDKHDANGCQTLIGYARNVTCKCRNPFGVPS